MSFHFSLSAPAPLIPHPAIARGMRVSYWGRELSETARAWQGRFSSRRVPRVGLAEWLPYAMPESRPIGRLYWRRPGTAIIQVTAITTFALRNIVNKGIPERGAMAVTGHRTRAVFDRYHIVSSADLRRSRAAAHGRNFGRSRI
jgi:hypothetical protein